MFPPIYESPPELVSPRPANANLQDPPAPLFRKYLPLSLSKDEVWQNSVFHEITAPVLIAQEFARLLRKSPGHIIFVSGCTESRFLCESIYLSKATKF